ncbi:ATP-binding protein [Actinomycetospora soli]|uniref:ATP-binding protein n=1 Tax=Actinomycetospora soli TaxID=2893887 RepID=UPI001E33A831|nr:ATP-binding protein [Actinomycetospora soli]MCD2191688.1 ATP-binding protein [Actinomycetospora soli]
MARHFLDVDGARTLPTPGLVAVDQAVEHLLDTAAMGVVHGPAGLGKSYAVEQALARHPATAVSWVEFPSRPTMRLVAAAMFTDLTRLDAGRRSRFALTDELIEALSRGPRVIVVDEAQRLNKDCIEFLRYLHDDRRTRFALLLVGGDDAWTVLSREPMLRSRIYRRVALDPLSGREVCDLLGALHPIYDNVDRELLLLVDDNVGHGNLRHWAAFTRSAVALCASTGRDRLDEEIARNVFAVHGAGVAV